MGEAAVAGGSSIASLGLGAMSDIMAGEGKQASYDMQAARAKRAAEFGRLQGAMTDTAYREDLNTTLSNIDVIRAAARVDPTSPTTVAYEDRQRTLSERQRMAAGLSIRSQVDEDEASAKFLREAGDFALTQAYLQAGTRILSGAAQGAGGGKAPLAIARS